VDIEERNVKNAKKRGARKKRRVLGTWVCLFSLLLVLVGFKVVTPLSFGCAFVYGEHSDRASGKDARNPEEGDKP